MGRYLAEYVGPTQNAPIRIPDTKKRATGQGKPPFLKIGINTRKRRAECQKQVGWFHCIGCVNTNHTVGSDNRDLECCGKKATGSANYTNMHPIRKAPMRTTRGFIYVPPIVK